MGQANQDITRILKASIAREMNKSMKDEFNTTKELATRCAQMAKKIVELEEERKRFRAIMTVAAGYLEEPLQHIEDMLRNNVPLPYESLADYSKMSRFMAAAFQRKHLAEVAERLMREQSE